MVRIRSPILFMAIVVLLTLGMAAGTAISAPPACPPGLVPAFPGSGNCILDPTMIDQYAIPLVIPPLMDNDGGDNSYDIAVRQFKQQILPGGIWNETFGVTNQTYPATTVWSYGPAADDPPDSSDLDGGGVGIAPAANSQFNYPAYTIETTSNTQVNVRWINDLVDPQTGRFLRHLLPVDQTLHWANPAKLCIDGTRRTDCRGFIPERYMGPVPIVTHVHGAHVTPESDGYPEAWWLPAATNIPGNFATHGTLFDDISGRDVNPGNTGYADFRYQNDQPATTLWYHDHALGMTRSNVYAGPAGFWLVRGGSNDTPPGVLPGPAPGVNDDVIELNTDNPVRNSIREIVLAIQDRSFKEDGSLFYPATRAFFEGVEPNQLRIPFIPSNGSDISAIWNPEAFFNTMVVNGVVWPKLEVAPAQYRFRLLNGCNSRFLWLKFNNSAVEVWQVGAEQGFLPGSISMNNNLDGSGDGTAQILMGLAERADVVVDFRGLANGTEIELLNLGPDEPFGGGIPGSNFDPADAATTGRVMKFVVNEALMNGGSDVPGHTTDPYLNDGITPNTGDVAENHPYDLPEEDALGAAVGDPRTLSLNEESSGTICVETRPNGTIRQIASVRPGPDFEARCEAAGGEPFGPKAALLGIMEGDLGNGGLTPVPLMWTDKSAGQPVDVKLTDGTIIPVYVTENPTEGNIEQWDIYNVTADAHPIHLHLVRFEVVNRQELPLDLDGEVEIPIVSPLGNLRVPEPWEEGYKDTVIAYPGEVTRIKAKFDIAGLYVWHCHIVEHEDNEMMRPFVVSEAAPAVAPAGVQQDDFGFGGL